MSDSISNESETSSQIPLPVAALEGNLRRYTLGKIFNAPNAWVDEWVLGANQEVHLAREGHEYILVRKNKKYTLHLSHNCQPRDFINLTEGRGAATNPSQTYLVQVKASTSENLRISLVVHEFDNSGSRISRHVIDPGKQMLYTTSSSASRLALSLRFEGAGEARIQGLEFTEVKGVKEQDPGLTPVKDQAASESKSISANSETNLPGNSFGNSAVLWGVGPEFEYASRIRRASGTYETFALRSKSLKIRDAFARNATNLQFDLQQLLRILRVMRGGKLSGAGAVIKEWDAKGLLTLARVLANQRILAHDLDDAAMIFNVVRKLGGGSVLGRSDNLIYTEVLSDLGRWTEAHKLSRQQRAFRGQPVQEGLFRANYALAASESPDELKWLEIINAMYDREAITAVELVGQESKNRLDRLKGTAEPRTVEGPQVSVIVPSFEGASLIRTTLDSLMSQTWANLEIIVVDDGSSKDNQSALEAVIDDYPEVQLVLQPQNRGAYVARNEGLKRSTGEYVTVHDDDDWSHPEKIERQVKRLLERPELRGTMSRHARSTNDLITTRINNNPLFSQANFSSLLVKREVFDDFGVWDEVNRGADAEFRDRILSDGQGEVEVVGQAPLSFTRTREVSLTAGDLNRGYIDPSRLFYVSAYQRAHRDKTMREYPRPLNMMPGKRKADLGSFDVVFMTDFRFPGGTSSLTVNEIIEAKQMGLRVGLLHIGSSVNGMKPPIVDKALDAAMLPKVEVLSPRDKFHTKLLIVRHPTVLQYADNQDFGFTAGRGILVVNHPPVLDGGSGYVYDLGRCRQNLPCSVTENVSVMAESGVTRSLLAAVEPSFKLDEELWPGFTSDKGSGPRVVDSSRVPVLGRHSRDSAVKWPDKLETLLQVYGGGPHARVRILGGISSLPKRHQDRLREQSEVLGFNGEPVDSFLDSIDFWAYFHSSSLTESFGMATVEAMLKGVVVILPHYMKKNFGQGAVYCREDEVRSVVKDLWSDPVVYLRQSEAGLRLAQNLYSEAAFRERLRKYMS
ncbi:glycosyltransferase [Nesterenkonia alkaliphila]|uniref:glycosyltransferase n=1 Tax=Nesterenkonia alkaliphila TaxID=1463631 RepID=UPI0016634FDC|nr:glycosyltransferase [Nesterenkonia alkaliphila]